MYHREGTAEAGEGSSEHHRCLEPFDLKRKRGGFQRGGRSIVHKVLSLHGQRFHGPNALKLVHITVWGVGSFGLVDDHEDLCYKRITRNSCRES